MPIFEGYGAFKQKHCANTAEQRTYMKQKLKRQYRHSLSYTVCVKILFDVILDNVSRALRMMSYCGHLPSVVVTLTSVVRPHLLKTSPLKTRGQFSSNHVEPSVRGGLKVCSNSQGPLIKMAAMSRYGKTLKIFFIRIKKALRLSIYHRGLKVYQMCSNDNHGLTFDLFTTMSNLCPYTFT